MAALEVRGLVRDGGAHGTSGDGDTHVIESMFTEHLAEPAISVTVDDIGTVTENDPFELEAILWDKATASHYQWMKDDDDIEGAYGPIYSVLAATPFDSGVYSCWAYDAATETYGISTPVTVTIMTEGAVPAGDILALLYYLPQH